MKTKLEDKICPIVDICNNSSRCNSTEKTKYENCEVYKKVKKYWDRK